MEELPQVTFRETWERRMVWNRLSLALAAAQTLICKLPLRKGSAELWTHLGIKRGGRQFKSWKGCTSPLRNWNDIHHPPSPPEHKRSLKSGIRNRLHTSEYLKSSARFIPSVWRTNSFSPSLLVLSLSRQRVMPFTSWITVLRARDASREEMSKYTLVSGNAKET